MFQIIKDHTAGIDYVKDDVLHVGDGSGVLVRDYADLDELPAYKSPESWLTPPGGKRLGKCPLTANGLISSGGDINGS